MKEYTDKKIKCNHNVLQFIVIFRLSSTFVISDQLNWVNRQVDSQAAKLLIQPAENGFSDSASVLLGKGGGHLEILQNT